MAETCLECERVFGVSHRRMVEEFKSNFFLTAKVLCGNPDLTDGLHKLVAEYLQRRITEGQRRWLILFPRGHFKTSLLSMAYPIWRVIQNPDVRILLVHASSTMSTRWLRAIREKMQSPLFMHFFGDLVPENPKGEGRRWTAGQIEVRRSQAHAEATITSIGLTSKVVGGHFDIQILDDVVEQQAARSPIVMEQALEFLKLADPLFVTPKKGERLVVGTFWSGGFYESLIERPSYEKIVFGCYVDDRFREFVKRAGGEASELTDGEPVFPERFSKKDLEDMEADMGPVRFSHQMLNVPVADDMMRFRPEDVRYYDWREDTQECIAPDGSAYPTSGMYVTMCVDPATGESTSTDESAITVCGHHRESGKIFVLDEWGGKVLPGALIDKILTMAEKWKPTFVGIERASFQSTLRWFLTDEGKRRGQYVNVQLLDVGNRSKVERIIDGLQPYVASGQVHFRKGWHEALVRQMLDLSVRREIRGLRFAGKSPNRVDSLAMHVPFWGGKTKRQDGVGGEFLDHVGVDGYPYGDEEDLDLPDTDYAPVFGLECVT